jgi:hypothetical protein
MHWNWKDKAGWFWLPLGAVLFWLAGARDIWPEGGQDSWNHYLHARWAFKHPELFTDQWGKPLYTLISAPFAVILGMQGAIWLNVLFTLLTGWLLYRAAWQMHWYHAWIAYPLTWFSPILFGNTISALTEPLNATLLAFVIWCFATNQIKTAALAASMLPLVRSEGYILLGITGLYLLSNKQWKLLPLLFSGTILLAMAGWAISGDWTWIVTQNPYIRFDQETRFHPGSGSFWHYVHQQRHIIGLGLLLPALGGWAMAGNRLLREKTIQPSQDYHRLILLLCGGMAAAYFLAHSYIWWTGRMGSHGLLRVFAVIVPCWVMAQLYFFHQLQASGMLRRFGFPLLAILTGYAGWQAYTTVGYAYPWKYSQRSIAPPPQAETLDKATAFLKNHGLHQRVLVHQLPYYDALLDIDPWEKPAQARSFRIWSVDWRNHFTGDWMPDSSIMLYDGYHARRDGYLPFDSLMTAPTWKLITHIPHSAAEPGKDHFDIWIFEKRRNPISTPEPGVMEAIPNQP